MNTTAKMPETIRELGDMAEGEGVTAAELLGKLGSIPTRAGLTRANPLRAVLRA